MILFDSTCTELQHDDQSLPPTIRVPVPLVIRIPIDWEVSDPLNDLEPITKRGWHDEQARR